MTKNRPNIVLVSAENYKWLSSFEANLRLLTILETLSNDLTWISQNCSGDKSKLPPKVTWIPLSLDLGRRKLFINKLTDVIVHQIRFIKEIRRVRNADVFMFWYGGDLSLFLPYIYAALFQRKKIILKNPCKCDNMWAIF